MRLYCGPKSTVGNVPLPSPFWRQCEIGLWKTKSIDCDTPTALVTCLFKLTSDLFFNSAAVSISSYRCWALLAWSECSFLPLNTNFFASYFSSGTLNETLISFLFTLWGLAILTWKKIDSSSFFATFYVCEWEGGILRRSLGFLPTVKHELTL